MHETRHFGLIGGLGVGATVLYYEGITAACAERGRVARMSVDHADAPTALAHVQAGRIGTIIGAPAGCRRRCVPEVLSERPLSESCVTPDW